MRCLPERIFRAFSSALLITALFLSAGCTSFDHTWRKSVEQPIPASAIEGPWDGTWLSDANKHTGRLQCVVTRKEDGTYRARYHAIYDKIVGFGYTVPLKTETTNGLVQFSGEANLGWLAGGVYHYEGHADGTNFFSTYSCKYDHGTFHMTRPRP